MKWKGLIALLVVSISLNILVLGIWVGREFLPGEPRGHHPQRVDFSLRQLGQYLPDTQRQEIRQLLKEHKKVLRQNFGAVRQVEQEIRDLLSAETVDRDALEKAMQSHRALTQELHFPVQKIVLDVVVDLDQATRAKLAENLFRRHMGGWHHKAPNKQPGFPPPPPKG